MVAGFGETWKLFWALWFKLRVILGLWVQFWNSSEIRDFRSGLTVGQAIFSPTLLILLLKAFFEHWQWIWKFPSANFGKF